MRKLGILVGEDNWTFFREIYAYLSDQYETEVYEERTFNTPLLYGRLNRWAFRRRVLSLLNSSDVCFFEWASDLLAPASNLQKRCSVVTRLHSFELYQWGQEINWGFVDRIILVSEAMRRRFGELFPHELQKVHVVRNGVSLSKFAPNPRREFAFHLGMLCGITPIKRIYEVVLLMHALRKQGYNARLHIAGAPKGDPRYATAVHRLVEKLRLDDIVRFYGHVSAPEAWLDQIDIFISNSYWEGHQVALVEAMASGCYCLSHAWDGAEEVLPADNLFVTETELREKIVEYAELTEGSRRERRQIMRDIACAKFDLEETKARIREVVEEAVATRT